MPIFLEAIVGHAYPWDTDRRVGERYEVPDEATADLLVLAGYAQRVAVEALAAGKPGKRR